MEAQFFRTTWLFKKLSEKYFEPYKTISKSSTLLFTLHLSEFMCSVYLVFYVFMLKPVISNIFSKRTQSVLTPVITDRKPEYEISWTVNFEINSRQACKLLYKIIWPEYKNTKDKSKWLFATKFTYIADLVANFHIIYSAKPRPLLLSWSHCYNFNLCYYTLFMEFSFIFWPLFSHLIFIFIILII